MGPYLFLNIIPYNFTVGTGRKLWCDQGMRLWKNELIKWITPTYLYEFRMPSHPVALYEEVPTIPMSPTTYRLVDERNLLDHPIPYPFPQKCNPSAGFPDANWISATQVLSLSLRSHFSELSITLATTDIHSNGRGKPTPMWFIGSVCKQRQCINLSVPGVNFLSTLHSHLNVSCYFWSNWFNMDVNYSYILIFYIIVTT